MDFPGIGKRRLNRLKEVIANRRRDVIVVLEDIHDPHNAEAIFRTCDGFGIQEAWLIFENHEPWDPKRVGKSSSSAANKWLDFRIFHSTTKCLQELKKNGYKTYATALTDSAQTLGKTQFSGKVALLVGNEHAGLSEKALKGADKVVMLPMKGMVQSLNVSVTTAIFLYEILKQKGCKALPAKDQTNLLKDFAKRARE